MINKAFTQEKIDVMQSFLKNGSVMCRAKYKGAYSENNEWYESQGPTWDWYRMDYKAVSNG